MRRPLPSEQHRWLHSLLDWVGSLDERLEPELKIYVPVMKVFE
jgi:hypothetical protein